MAHREVRFSLPKGATLRQSVCRSCNAPIFWMVTKADKKMPLDIRSQRLEPNGERSYLSHFATCPQANQHRRP